MTDQQDKKLIAEFMDYHHEGKYIILSDNSKLKYHTDWNWLMSVVKKIEALEVVIFFHINYTKYHNLLNDVRIHINSTKNHIISSLEEHKDNKIKATYFTVVEFIKWYNQQGE